MHRADSIYSRTKTARELIARNKLNDALTLIHDTVETIITEPICSGQGYGSPTLDALCLEIGQCLFKREAYPTSSQTDSRPTYVYLATKLQRSGGHTRLVRDFILARPAARHVILLTELAGASDHHWLADTFRRTEHYQCLVAPKGNFEEKLRWAQRMLMQLSPTHIYLFQHHADVVAAAALVPAMGLTGSFCHHGDHHLCLGVHLPHLEHLDFHPAGYHQCRLTFGIENCYLPLTVPDRGTRPSAAFLVKRTLTTCTAAGTNKVEIPYMVPYVEVIPALLAATGGTHIHIGKLTGRARRHIIRALAARKIDPARFIYIPWVPSVWDALIEHQVDLYLCSFPYGGGLTMIEAMGAGIPLAVHRHITIPTLGGFDLAYPDAFLWQAPEALIAYCVNLTANFLLQQSAQSRRHFEGYYNGAQLAALLEGTAICTPQPIALENYQPHLDERALWMAEQISLPHLIRRFLYRRMRHWRVRMA